jgi:hypothetical protein
MLEELLIWIARLVFIIFVLRAISRLFGAPASAGARRAGSAPPRQPPERAGGTLVRDPQCGTYIPLSRALTVGGGADALHFCSSACRDAWTAAHAH